MWNSLRLADFGREAKGERNFLVSLKVVGRALLRHMADLGMEEMMRLHRIEEAKDLNGTEILSRPICP